MACNDRSQIANLDPDIQLCRALRAVELIQLPARGKSHAGPAPKNVPV